MNKGKTNYTFQFNTEPNLVDNIVKAWLQANKFNWTNKYGEDFYFFNDPVLYGQRGFQYKIEGQTISINAWTIGFGKKFYMLDSGAINNMAGDSYKSILQNLFSKISELDGKSGIDSIETVQSTSNEQVVENFVKESEEQDVEKKEKLCKIGFVLSIIGLLLSFFGVMVGLIIYVIDLYFAILGLKTSKKGMAVATIVMSVISLLITVFWFINANMLVSPY